MDLQEIFADPEIHSRICQSLTFREANGLREAYHLPILYCSFTVVDKAIGEKFIIPEVTDLSNRFVTGLESNIFGVLFKAVKRDDQEMLNFLQRIGALQNYKFPHGDNVLTAAINEDSLDLVEKLLEYGFDPNEKVTRRWDPSRYIYDEQELAPIHIAIDNNNLKMVKLLLKNGVPLNTTTANTNSLLEYALRIGENRGRKRIIEYLKQVTDPNP